MRQLVVEHVTEFDFGAEVQLLPHRLLLRPRESHNVRIAASVLDISPTPSIRWLRDVYDNSVALVSFASPASRLRIASMLALEHYEEAPLDFLVEQYAVTYPFEYSRADQLDLEPLRTMLWPEQRDAVTTWLGSLSLPEPGVQTFALLDRINRAIANNFRYQARDEEGVQPPARTLALGSGSCRDFATLFMEACHCLGLATRFVSGYQTRQLLDQQGSTHAWVDVYVPGPGWKGFDPAAGLVTGTQHIATAVARHPELVPFVSGSFVASSQLQPKMQVSVSVREGAPEAVLTKRR